MAEHHDFRPRSKTMPTHLEDVPKKYRGYIKFVPSPNREYVLVQVWEHEKVVFRKECKKGTVKVFGRRVSFRSSRVMMLGTQDTSPDTKTKIPRTMIHFCRGIGAVKINSCSEHNIDLAGERKWVMFGPESDFVIDIQNGRVVLKRESGSDSQKWWREGGFIRNKAYPDKVLAVAWPSSNFDKRPKGKLAILELVDEDRTAYNQRWIYNIDDNTLESGVPGRYVIDCWHASGSFCIDGPVIVYQDLRNRRQKIRITHDDLLSRVRPNSVHTPPASPYSVSMEDISIFGPTFTQGHTEPAHDEDKPTSIQCTKETRDGPLPASDMSDDGLPDLELDASNISADNLDQQTLNTSNSSCKHCGQDTTLLQNRTEHMEELKKVANELDLDAVVAECTPAQLSAMYRHLQITPNKIESAKMDNRDLGFREQNIAVLRQWRQATGREATRETIVTALTSSGNAEVAHKMEDKFVNNNV